MTSQTEFKLAFRMAIVLFVAGVLSYAVLYAQGPKADGEPLRSVYECAVGKVLFDHKTHMADYDLTCIQCHHHPDGDEADTRSCGACHNLPADGSLPAACLDCHDEGDYEADVVIKRSDAFHGQCIGCHKEIDSGPMDCSGCHFKPFVERQKE